MINAVHDSLSNGSYESMWDGILDKIRIQMGPAVFNTWFANLDLKEIKGDTITITAPSRFIREWVLTNYYNQLKDHLLAEDPTIKRIDVRVRNPQEETQINNKSFGIQQHISPPISNITYALDSRFTLNNFVVGESNKLAYAAAQAVALEGIHNPLVKGVLYIKGPVGMGKTHLLHAIAQELSIKCNDQRVLYMSAEKFMHEYIGSVKCNQIYSFRENLREIDVLLFDDLQFICGKSGTQQEFANTLSAIMEGGKLVIASSDRSPYELELDQRTTSRLTGGLVIDIKKPDIELRTDILRSKAFKISMDVPQEVINFIAKSVTSSIRELEAALNKVVTSARLMNHSIDMELTRETLKDCLLAHETGTTIERIIDIVANYYGITNAELISKGRAPKIAYPRQVATFLAKQLTDKSLQEIGMKMGKRDHATVIYSIKKLEQMLEIDSAIAAEINKLTELLRSN
jgi:chromosomal replication initiator protein